MNQGCGLLPLKEGKNGQRERERRGVHDAPASIDALFRSGSTAYAGNAYCDDARPRTQKCVRRTIKWGVLPYGQSKKNVSAGPHDVLRARLTFQQIVESSC